jgi:hypothetical protein
MPRDSAIRSGAHVRVRGNEAQSPHVTRGQLRGSQGRGPRKGAGPVGRPGRLCAYIIWGVHYDFESQVKPRPSRALPPLKPLHLYKP